MTKKVRLTVKVRAKERLTVAFRMRVEQTKGRGGTEIEKKHESG